MPIPLRSSRARLGADRHRRKTRILSGGSAVYEIIRVRAVQHDKLFVVFGAGFHHVMHCADIGIETGTYILYIENNHVKVAQLLGGRFLVFPINRDDGDA